MEKKIQQMIKWMMDNYQGSMRSRHLSIALYGKIQITDYKYNHLYPKVLGHYRKSNHAELNVLQTLLNNYDYPRFFFIKT